MSVDTKLKELIINTLSPEQLPEQPSETEIYLVEDDKEYATVEELAEKQDKLTAGAGINIDDNNVISASGAVESVNGKTGVVVLTGEDIAADVSELTDTVQGHLQTLHDKVQDIELFKFPNATIIGEPVIQSGQVSGFSPNDYLQFPFIVDLHNQPFVIDFCFTTGDDVTTQQNILDSQFGLALAIANGKGLMAISHNGTSWAGSVVGTMNINPNTTYYARLSWNRINYQTQLSTDGTTYTPDMNFGSTQSPYPRTMFIGGCSGSAIGHSPHPFKGTINMNDAYLTVAGNVIWQGMDDAGLATRLASDVSNITEEGKERIKQIAGGGSKTPLLTNIWSDHILNDISWLRADTFSWQSGDVYTSVYNLLESEWNNWWQSHTVDDREVENGVYFIRSASGFKIAGDVDEQNIINAYNSTGVAWYYVIDTANRRFKLPRTRFGFSGLRDSVGGYVEPGLPNIAGNISNGYCSYLAKTSDGAFFWSGAGGVQASGQGGSGYNVINIDASRSSSIYGNSNTVQPAATQMYLYFYVGQFTQTATEQTAGLNAELFNGKADLDRLGHIVVEFQEPTEANGYTWYRRYADGWVEQGGCYTNSNTTQPTRYKHTITWTIPFANTNYTVAAIGWSADDSSYYMDGVSESSTTPRTTTSFTVDHETQTIKFNLIAFGMAA